MEWIDGQELMDSATRTPTERSLQVRPPNSGVMRRRRPRQRARSGGIARAIERVSSASGHHAGLLCRREALETDVAVNRAIAEHYRMVEEVGPYVIMKRTTSPSAS